MFVGGPHRLDKLQPLPFVILLRTGGTLVPRSLQVSAPDIPVTVARSAVHGRSQYLADRVQVAEDVNLEVNGRRQLDLPGHTVQPQREPGKLRYGGVSTISM